MASDTPAATWTAAPAPALNDDLPTAAATLTRFLTSFALSLESDDKAGSTMRTYLDAATRLARWLTLQRVTTWAEVRKPHMQSYMVWLMKTATRPDGKAYAKGYANNQYRALQAYWKWYAAEEDAANPMTGMQGPKPDTKVTPTFSEADLARLLKQVEKKNDFESRRDTAILRLFAATGIRLTELATILLSNVDLGKGTVLVYGKGRKERIVKFDKKTVKALDRYIRVREDHKEADHKRLWLAVKNRGPLTPNGVRQIIERRGANVGLDIHPHMFRHDFSDRWLRNGGAEGDLMELNGWESPQMLRHYARGARSERARSSYDRVNVLGDI